MLKKMTIFSMTISFFLAICSVGGIAEEEILWCENTEGAEEEMLPPPACPDPGGSICCDVATAAWYDCMQTITASSCYSYCQSMAWTWEDMDRCMAAWGCGGFMYHVMICDSNSYAVYSECISGE